MNDLISRQAAIDALYHVDEYNRRSVEAIGKLPSVQPEIIRCKDCKYKCETEDGEYNPYDIVCDYWASDGLKESDYCSYAERKE